MSDLITNLNQIYATKLEIKSVLGTESDTFSEYPSLIEEAIAGGVSGYAYITTNGDHDIASYAYVNVNVQGGVAVLGDLSVSENGVYAASSYAYDGFESVSVEVPIDWNAVENTYGYVLPSGTYLINNNGNYDVKTAAYVSVEVSGGSSTVTVEGQYLIGKGGSGDEYTINRGFYYVYDSDNSTYYTLAEPLGNPLDRPKLGDVVSVTGNVLVGHVITPISYTVTSIPTTYQYVDLSNFELYGTGDKEIAYVVNGVGVSDRITTYDNKWGYYPGGDYYNIIADSVSNISFTAGNDLTAYIVSEAVEEDGYYGYTYYIREVVINRSPIITGLEYSADHGENWSSASFDSTDMVYNINGLSISDSDMISLYLRADIGNGNYLYFGDTSLEISNVGVDVSDSLNRSRASELSTGIMNQTGSAGTVSATISTVNSTISARITA